MKRNSLFEKKRIEGYRKILRTIDTCNENHIETIQNMIANHMQLFGDKTHAIDYEKLFIRLECRIESFKREYLLIPVEDGK